MVVAMFSSRLFSRLFSRWPIRVRALVLLPLLMLTIALAPQSQATELDVIDAYLEVHTGPGRGYPIFHTIEQGASVDVSRRRANWYFVRDRRGREGWVERASLGRTLAKTGVPVALPDTRHGDFLQSQMRVGFTVGQQEEAETTSINFGYRLTSWLGAEVEGGQIFGESIDGIGYGASAMIEPISRWNIAPFVSYGMGKQRWEKKDKQQVGSQQIHNNDYQFTGLGLNYYIGFNFLIRLEGRAMKVIGKNDTVSNTAWRIGFNSFF